MVRRFYDLPPVTSLSVFEAAARHASFTLAAAELNVTPGAVSRQIRALEEDLGVALFLRHNKGVRLTASGEELFHVLARGFAQASEVVRAIRRGDTARKVTVACSDVFGSMWLLPRMPEFWRRFPEVKVDHLISDNTRDFRRAEVDLRVRFGSGGWAEETAQFLFDDRVYPVCSPAYARAHRDDAARDWTNLPLLDVEWVASDWLRWEDLLAQAGLARHTADIRRFGKFSVALQAAMAEQGLVIGWHRIVAPLVRDGTLVRFTDLVLCPPGGYHLTWNSNRALTPAATLFRAWMLEMAAAERLAPSPSPTVRPSPDASGTAHADPPASGSPPPE
ncbi:LysR substrate-binding domain-containing protein [Rubellimicrobium arenae]|uniref:LysR substrate-binding domain-containing protein n=1 Tax=Rubellimicrobium arenae TaxID=2817372 RepID=UPI001B30623F|nr:LysR substrate-binding domain-containing protein [Rubellimicrobium arenae]